MARYLLLTDLFENHGLIRRGTVIERPDDWKGPMRTVMAASATYDETQVAAHHDEPCYRRLDDGELMPGEAEARQETDSRDDALARANRRNAELERENDELKRAIRLRQQQEEDRQAVQTASAADAKQPRKGKE